MNQDELPEPDSPAKPRHKRAGGSNPAAGRGKGGTWEWTPQRQAVALDLALAELTLKAIAEKHGISDSTIDRWKAAPQMQSRIAELHAAFQKHICDDGIAVMPERVRERKDRFAALKLIAKERGASVDMKGIPGGSTGFLVKQVKGIGKGEDFERVETYALDRGLLAEMRELEDAVAIDQGQRVNKTEVTGAGGGPIRIDAAATVGYQNGTLKDIALEFLELIAMGAIPLDVEQAKAAVEAQAHARNLQTVESVKKFESGSGGTDA